MFVGRFPAANGAASPWQIVPAEPTGISTQSLCLDRYARGQENFVVVLVERALLRTLSQPAVGDSGPTRAFHEGIKGDSLDYLVVSNFMPQGFRPVAAGPTILVIKGSLHSQTRFASDRYFARRVGGDNPYAVVAGGHFVQGQGKADCCRVFS
jgi:hypothetical protein